MKTQLGKLLASVAFLVTAPMIAAAPVGAAASWGPWHAWCNEPPYHYLHLTSRATGNITHEYTVPTGFNRHSWSNGSSFRTRTSYLDWPDADPAFMHVTGTLDYFAATCHT